MVLFLKVAVAFLLPMLMVVLILLKVVAVLIAVILRAVALVAAGYMESIVAVCVDMSVQLLWM